MACLFVYFSLILAFALIFFTFHSSAEWKNLDENQREKLGINTDNDGEFWLENFADCKCNLSAYEIHLLVLFLSFFFFYQFRPEHGTLIYFFGYVTTERGKLSKFSFGDNSEKDIYFF